MHRSSMSMSMSSLYPRHHGQTRCSCMKSCLQYLWITRLSLRFDQMPCLVILLMLSACAVYYYCFVEPTPSMHVPASFASQMQQQRKTDSSDAKYKWSAYANLQSLRDQHHVLNENYPYTYVVKACIKIPIYLSTFPIFVASMMVYCVSCFNSIFSLSLSLSPLSKRLSVLSMVLCCVVVYAFQREGWMMDTVTHIRCIRIL